MHRVAVAILATTLMAPHAAIAASCVASACGGVWQSVLLRTDGSVGAFGGGELAQLGNGLHQDTGELQVIPGLGGVIAARAGGFHSLALQSDGSVVSWGLNNSGQLGTGDRVASPLPVPVTGLADVVAVAAGGFHSLALKRDGSVMAWGRNASWQLGNNVGSFVPIPVMGLPDFTTPMTGVTTIAAGFLHSLAIGPGGVVYAWGSDARGQLNGLRDGSRMVEVAGLSGIVAIAGGVTHSLALGGDGRGWAWGSNLSGQLGNGSQVDPLVPITVPGLSGVTAIAAGGYHSLALLSDGTVRAWGYNYYGQIGDGTTLDVLSPTAVPGLVNIEAIGAGRFHSLAIDRDGVVWAWGMNQHGQLGDGSVRSSPVAVRTSTPCRTCSVGASVARPAPVRAGAVVTLDASASIGEGCPGLEYQWEEGATVLRPFAPDPRLSVTPPARTVYRVRVRCLADPTCEASAEVVATVVPAPACAIVAIASSSYHGLALGSNGRVWAWGDNMVGQCGLGASAPTTVPLPTKVPDLVDIVAIAARGWTSFAVDVDGRLWAWGAGTLRGLLGDGDYGLNLSTVPRLVPEVREAQTVSAGGNHVLVLERDGTVWGFGHDAHNQLGAGTWHLNGSYSTPAVPAVELDRVIAVAAGAHYGNATSGHSLMLRDDGALWVVGSGSGGELGRGTFERVFPYGPDLAAPTLAPPPTTAIAAGYLFSLAVDGSGALRAWGSNIAGQLGDGTVVDSPTPTVVGGLPLARTAAAVFQTSMALARDGSVWTWGQNDRGSLGNGTTVSSTRPAAVTGLGSVTAIAAGSPMLALQSDGSLWAWGDNNSGQLGQGSVGGMSSVPVKVVASWNLPAPPVDFNSLRAIRNGGDAVFTWTTSATLHRFNLHRTDLKSDLASLWLTSPLGDDIAGLTYTDPMPTPAAGTSWHYQVFGADCAGLSEP